VIRWRAFRAARWVWTGWERIWLRFHPVTPVRPGSLFGTRRVGHTLELHLDGRALARMRREPGYSTFKAVHRLREELGVVAGSVRRGELGDVKSIRGTSLMGVAGGVLGFEVRPLPRNFANVLKQYFLVGLDAIYHPRGLRERAMRRWPVETWMPVAALLERYPEKSDRSTMAR
jgi:YkoP-like protein